MLTLFLSGQQTKRAYLKSSGFKIWSIIKICYHYRLIENINKFEVVINGSSHVFQGGVLKRLLKIKQVLIENMKSDEAELIDVQRTSLGLEANHIKFIIYAMP